MNTFICSQCFQEHEIYDVIDDRGRHKLKFLCHGVRVQTKNKAGEVVLKSYTKELPYTGDATGPFREVWSSKLVKQEQGKNQFQLILMNEPGREKS